MKARVSQRLCMCQSYITDLGFCFIFEEYPLLVQLLNKVLNMDNTKNKITDKRLKQLMDWL